MTFLPIVQRELRVASRRPGTYRGRVAVVFLAIVAFAWIMYFLLPSVGVSPALQGSVLYRGLLVVSAVYGWLGVTGVTADMLSREKREGTLGLLFLTDLRGYDVVLGKLAAALLNTAYALVGIVPVLWLSLQLGGVTLGEVVRGAAALLNLSFVSLAVGLFVSVLSVHERKAFSAAAFLMFFLAVGPFLLGILLFGTVALTPWRMELLQRLVVLSPVFPIVEVCLGASGFGVGAGRAPFWPSLACSHATAWLLLVGTAVWLRRAWSERADASVLTRLGMWWERRLYGWGTVRERFRQRLLNRHPVLWLMHRDRGKSWYAWLYFLSVIGVWMVGNSGSLEVLSEVRLAVPGLLLIQGFFKIWVISESCTQLAEDRRTGAMELLLTTSVTPDELVRGHWLALGRQFLWPSVVFAVFEAWVLHRLVGPAAAAAGVLILAADLLALGWMGMWNGLSTRSPNRAILRTSFWVLVLPWLLFSGWVVISQVLYRGIGLSWRLDFSSLFTAWWCCGLLVDVVVGYGWARRRLETDFRRVVSDEPADGSVFGLRRGRLLGMPERT